MEQKLALQEPDELIRRTFRAFDDGAKGFISARDFDRVVAAVAPHLPHQTVSLVFAQVDSDGDGRISYRDFHAMMSARPNGCSPLNSARSVRYDGASPVMWRQ